MAQRTLIIIKPDGVQRGLIGEILSRFERRGLKIVGLKLVPINRSLAETHYAVHRDKPFFAFYSMALAHDVTDDVGTPPPLGPQGHYDSYKKMVENQSKVLDVHPMLFHLTIPEGVGSFTNCAHVILDESCGWTEVRAPLVLRYYI